MQFWIGCSLKPGEVSQEQAARPGGGGGRAPHPREQGVVPLAFIFGDDFSLFILILVNSFKLIKI